jgi:biotin carboxyl carrier protein
MRYYVTLDPGAEPAVIDVDQLPTGQTEVRIGGRLVEVDVASVGTVLSVRVAGRMVDLTTEGTPPEVGAIASGRRAYVRVESERMRAARSARGGGAGAGEKVLRSPMPGRVVKVLVEKG